MKKANKNAREKKPVLEESGGVVYVDDVITFLSMPHPLGPELILYTLAINDRGVSITFLSKQGLLDFIDSFVSFSKDPQIATLRNQVLMEKEAVKV